MTLVRTTLTLYWEALKDAFKAFLRTWVALGFLLVSGIAMTVAGMALGPTGFAGGLVLGFVQCALIGTYLALIEIGLVRKRTVAIDDIQGNLGQYFGRTISVGFAVSLPALILGFVSPPLAIAWVLITALIFNSALEALYQERDDDFLAIFRKSMNFLSHNWPEWLGAHVPILAPLAAFYVVLSSSAGLDLAVFVLRLYSPHYGFFSLSLVSAELLRSGTLGALLAIALLAVNHFVVLFRGALYSKLARSNRRARAWQARAEGR